MALIGAGIFARETYIPNLQQFAGQIQLTAVLSRSAESIAALLALTPKMTAGTVDTTDAVAQFIGVTGEAQFFATARNICDAVIITVPIPLLATYIERSLAIGLHVLSEKPVAMTGSEARYLIKLYREPLTQKCSWSVAENYRFEEAIIYAAAVVRAQPTVPKTFTFLALREQFPTSKFAATLWRANPAYQGSFVLDGGIHFVALLRSILGLRNPLFIAK